MLSDVLKCFLEVLLVCAFFTGSDARATNNAGNSDAFNSASSDTYAGAVASAGTSVYALNGANAFTDAFAETGSFPGVYEGHKEIPNYDNINFPHDNDANRGVKSLNHRGTKSEGHDHNKDGDGCSKCKWENDDYWERDETEEERDENDGDECDDSDDGQYKPDKTHFHSGSGKEYTFGSNLSGVHKTEVTSVYNDDVTNFPVSTGYVSSSSYESTPKFGSSWNTPFASTSKPEYGGVTANTFMTSYRLGTGWNKGTTLASSGYAPKLAWGSEHGNTFGGSFETTSRPKWNTGFGSTPATARFFSSQKPGLSWNTNHDNTLVGNYRTTSKSGTNWNTVAPGSGFPTSQKPETLWSNAHDGTPVGSYGTTLKSEPEWNTGSTPKTGYSFSHKPAPNWNGDYGNTPAGSFKTTSKPGLNWNTGLGTSTVRFPSSQNPIPNWNPDHGNTPTGNFGTTSKLGSNWHTEYNTPTAKFSPTQKPVEPWNTGHDNIFVENSGTTSKTGQNQYIGFNGKPGTSWNPSQGITSFGTFDYTQPDSICNLGKQGPVKIGATLFDNAFVKSAEFSSNISPGTSYRGSSTFSLNSPKGPNGNQNGQFQTAGTGTSGVRVGISVTPNFGSMLHNGTSGFGQKGYPFGFDKSISTLTPYGNRPYDKLGQMQPQIVSGIYSLENASDYNKSRNRPHTTLSSSVTSTFGPTKSPQERFTSPVIIPGVHSNTFSSEKSPESLTGGSLYEYPRIPKPSYRSEITATSSWSNIGHIGSESSSWFGSGLTYPHARLPESNTAFRTTKTPFGHVSTPGSSSSLYSGTGPKSTSFNAANNNAVASANANALGTSFRTYNILDITETTSTHRTPSVYTGILSYSGIKSPSENIKPTYEVSFHDTQPVIGTGVWPSNLSGDGRETWPGKQPGSESGIRPDTQSSSGNVFWPEKQPENDITPSYPESGARTWPSKQLAHGSTTMPGGHPEIGISPGELFTDRSNAWPTQQHENKSGIGSGEQVEHKNGPKCKGGSCGSPTVSFSGSNSCGENCNYGGGCSRGGGNNAPTIHGLCGKINELSGVNKIYYPVGTSDSNIPNIANTHETDSFPNIGGGVYPEIYTGCGTGDNTCNQGNRDVTPRSSVQWNYANPFLHGGIPSDVSRPWSEITPKSIGKGNLFLESNWSTPKPGGINTNNDRNVIFFGQENTKSFKENPFPNDNKRRGNIKFNIDEQLIPLGGRKSEENHLFSASSRNGSNGLNGPLYDEEPARSHESGAPGIDGNGDIKSDPYSERVSPQSGNSGISYPAGSNRQSTNSLQCEFGLFGCGTPGSRSYAATKGDKHPEEIHGGMNGNIGAGIGNLGNVKSGPGEPGNFRTRIGPVPGNYEGEFNIGASQLGSAGNNLAGSIGGAHAGAYAGSFSSAQAFGSSFANAKSFFSGTRGHGDNFDQANSGSWSSSGAQNQGGLNSRASSAAFTFTSSAGSWPGNHPVDVKS